MTAFAYPDDEWLCDELYRYYCDCIRGDQPKPSADDDELCSPFEAAHGLVDLFEWVHSGKAGGKPAAWRMAHSITELFRASVPKVRNCIETGFLEHVLEISDAREYFDHWQQDLELADSYRAALMWGKAHSRTLAP